MVVRILNAFLAEWGERFGGRPVQPGVSDCLAFVADWVGDEDLSARIRAVGLPGLRKRSLLGDAGVYRAAADLGLYRVAQGDIQIGDIGWLRHSGVSDEWAAGVAGIYGGKMSRVGGGADPFWWVLREPSDAAAHPILQEHLNREPLVFRLTLIKEKT